MKNKRKILYIEDMEECYKKTKEAIGNDFEIDWKKNFYDALEAIDTHLADYAAVISDINLDYKPDKPNSEQTRYGLYLIKIIKEEAQRQKIKIPVICASSNGVYREPSLEAGANSFLWKKELWEGKGKKTLDDLFEKI
jgi:CheY-like chemotaxis protein